MVYKGVDVSVNEYIEEKSIYTIDNQEYTVIARTKNNNDTDGWGIKNTKYQKVTNLELLKNKEYKESV